MNAAKTGPSWTPGEQTRTTASATNATSAALVITTLPTRSAPATLMKNAAQTTTIKRIVIAHATLNQNAVLTITMTGELTSSVYATRINTVAKTPLVLIPTYQTLFATTAPQTKYVALDITGP